jgi:7,8-dihydropterin-6-yl-methyl-4-(beta-D-ribofuranosyl)aminobenzene 5'-phosphate synthase
MRRRDLIATALAAPALQLSAGCASTSAAIAAEATPHPQITVLYDAFGRDGAMQKDWGYAAFIEMNGKRVLFDTGNNADVLAHNAVARNVDLSRLDFVVMSHRHGDHMGGMSHLLSANPKVKIFAPKEGFGVYGADLPSTFYRKDESLAPEQRYFDGKPPAVMRFGAAWPQANIVLVDKATEAAPGFHLISLVSDKQGTLELRELSLAIETPEGIVVIVGCSHTGLDNILKAAATIRPEIRLVAGGFHFVVAKDSDIEALVTVLRETYKVSAVAPGHCTGEPTFAALRKAFGDDYLYAGLGSRLSLSGTPRTIGAIDGARGVDDLQSYEALRAAANERRRTLFTRLTPSVEPGVAYLAQWRRSAVGCC